MAFGVKVFILPKVRSFSFVVVVELSLLYHFYVSATFRKVLDSTKVNVRTYEIELRSGFLIPKKNPYNSPCRLMRQK